MFKAAARFAFPLILSAAGLFGGQAHAQDAGDDAPLKTDPYAVPMRDTARHSYRSAHFHVMGVQPSMRAPLLEKRRMAIRGMAITTADYNVTFGVGDGETALDSATVADGLAQLGDIETHCYNIVLDLRAAPIARTENDTTWIDHQVYRNDSETDAIRRSFTSTALFGALGKMLTEVANEKDDEKNILLAVPGVMGSIADFGQLPPGTRLLAMSDAQSPLYHPMTRLMTAMNPHAINHTNAQRSPGIVRGLSGGLISAKLDNRKGIDPFYLLEAAVATSAKENKLLAVFVTDQKAEEIIVNGKTVYGGGNEVIVVDLEELTGKLMRDHKKNFTGAGGNYVTSDQAGSAEYRLKKLHKKGLPLDSLHLLSGKPDPKEDKFREEFSVEPLQVMKAMALEFVSGTDFKTKQPRYLLEGVGMTGAEYFRLNCLKPADAPRSAKASGLKP